MGVPCQPTSVQLGPNGHQPHRRWYLDVRRAKLQEEIKQLERAKNDMQVEESFLQDKFRQLKSENDRLKDEITTYRTRLGNATEDYVRVLACMGAEVLSAGMLSARPLLGCPCMACKTWASVA